MSFDGTRSDKEKAQIRNNNMSPMRNITGKVSGPNTLKDIKKKMVSRDWVYSRHLLVFERVPFVLFSVIIVSNEERGGCHPEICILILYDIDYCTYFDLPE